MGDTYTILLTGKDTAGRYCLIDMYVPPGGGPPPHRHDFEESFTIDALEGLMLERIRQTHVEFSPPAFIIWEQGDFLTFENLGRRWEERLTT